MTELVLAINRTELDKQDVGNDGLYNFDLSTVDQRNYALLPRTFADNKSDTAIDLGVMFPQILGYFQIVNPDGRILAYQRKGKEKGLLGKWSIGVGGHVNQEDMYEVEDYTGETYPDVGQLIYAGAVRELEEELGIQIGWVDELADYDSFEAAVNKILASFADKTSTVHVGIPLEVRIPEHIAETLFLDPSEFLNYQWLAPTELKSGDLEWETWSKLLIDGM